MRIADGVFTADEVIEEVLKLRAAAVEWASRKPYNAVLAWVEGEHIEYFTRDEAVLWFLFSADELLTEYLAAFNA